ncbi:MAG: creatininase family protein [Limimaricola sp.]|uniref:creatininase family protein n=1 Tax=Limimaricola sp. TaxID=2211665 RepID=UPI001E16DD9C|nr:creatininase family protein [Limimaricola sp.]MBI1416807.1 creatininase family protein [Limimaricola sp.]
MGIVMHWAEMSAPAFRSLPQDTVAILPLGAVEQHGPHLPLSVDYCIVEAVLDRALRHVAEPVSALILPTLRVTKSDEHARYPGTLSLSAETLLAVLRDIGASVARAGVARLVLFNGHGGNTALLQVASRELRIAHDMIVVTCSWSAFADTKGLFDPETYALDMHAGESETAAMLAARPDLVDMAAAPAADSVLPAWRSGLEFIGVHGAAGMPSWLIDDLSASGVVGDARAADAERGAQLLDSAAANFARFLAEFSVFDHRRKS